METNNQRIIFNTPEETTPASIISEILKKNGIGDVADDLLVENKIPKLKIVSDASKDFFDKKISEENLISLLQNQLSIPKENAVGITAGLKEKLIPFGLKVTVPKYVEKPTEDNKISTPINPKVEPTKTVKKTRTIKNVPIEPEKIVPKSVQPKGPDTYREPIE